MRRLGAALATLGLTLALHQGFRYLQDRDRASVTAVASISLAIVVWILAPLVVGLTARHGLPRKVLVCVVGGGVIVPLCAQVLFTLIGVVVWPEAMGLMLFLFGLGAWPEVLIMAGVLGVTTVVFWPWDRHAAIRRTSE